MVSHNPSVAVMLHSRTKHFLVATLRFLKIKLNNYFNPIYPKYFNINHDLKFLRCACFANMYECAPEHKEPLGNRKEESAPWNWN